MMGEPWFYWLILGLAVVMWLAVPLIHRWERRQDERDRETWERVKNGRRL